MNNYEIKIEWSEKLELYSILVNGEVILECLSPEEVREIDLGQLIKFYEEV